MDIAIRNQVNTNFKAVNIKVEHQKLHELANNALKEYKDNVNIVIKQVSQKNPWSDIKVLITNLNKSESEYPHPIKMRFDFDYGFAGIIANIQKIIKEFVKGDMSGKLYVPDKGEFPEEIEKAIPRLEKLADRFNIFVLPYRQCGEKGYYVFAENPGFSYREKRTFNPKLLLQNLLTGNSKVAKKAIVQPLNYHSSHQYQGLITERNLELSEYNNWSDIIVDAAEFFVNNMKEGKTNLEYRNARRGW